MKIISYISVFMIPFLILYVIGYGLSTRRNIYSDFLEGAEEGLKIIWKLIPTLIGLMTAVGVLRESGFLDFLGRMLSRASGLLGVDPELFPLGLIRLFSSSAANGLLLDIFKQYGTDSPTGLMAALMLSATESVFYCISVYFGGAGIQKPRYTLAGALLASLAGMAASVCIVKFLL
ncbi:nucleoside recognition domain-containing protein [Blautia sp. MSJ-19]|uniref:nucleoside recognition domain-containing protein n=1 Tax=Blautia sp. MSJ-19 TaxID=2841517 RepID=UPI001C0EF134|nr:nucleoside recognition domain-containing protein [Blautia sp. MSJ-19]MBU5482100.1 spore maturation protein [Blautia sp. MSJ-19]